MLTKRVHQINRSFTSKHTCMRFDELKAKYVYLIIEQHIEG